MTLTALLLSVYMSIASPANPAAGRIVSIVSLTPEALQYAKVEWAIVIEGKINDPYDQTQATLDLRLVEPNHHEILVPAYYERGKDRAESIWRLRFAPRQVGQYTGVFELQIGNEVFPSRPVRFRVKKSKSEGFLHVKNEWACVTDSGRLYRGVGYNIGWESRSQDDSKHFKDLQESARYSYEYLLGQLAASGGNFFRTWICSWNLPIHFCTPSNLERYSETPNPVNPSGCARLDELVELCDRLGIRMMLCLFAGFADWEGNSLNVKHGGPLRDPIDFLATPQGRHAAKNILRYAVARWGYSPSIGAWEFFNEIDNFMYSRAPRVSDELVSDWHKEMSAYLKHIDPYGHIVTTSISHRDVQGLDQVPEIDINQKHIYKNSNAMASTVVEYLKRFKKPYVIGEFGYEWDWTKDFNGFKDDMDLDFKQGLWIGAFSPTPILPMSWWWEYFDRNQIEPYVGHVAKFNEALLKESGGQIVLDQLRPEGKPIYQAEISTPKARYVLVLNRSHASVDAMIQLPGELRAGSSAYDVESDRQTTLPEPVGASKTNATIRLESGGGIILRIPRE